jgi:site-specific DNA-cytosine methylase
VSNAVDLFSGIGWGFACKELGIHEHGIDIEPTVAATRAHLHWPSTMADIRELDPTDWAGVEGLIASPPCQSWSKAGKGEGLDDPRGQLVWQPLVWALAIKPKWVALEQVPPARGAFEQIAHRLSQEGYHTDVYELSSETFGVPQTRRRVFLTAHRDRRPRRPEPTHQRYVKGKARIEPVDMLGHLPWVSMAEALGPGMLDLRSGWMEPFDMADRPSPTVTATAGGETVWTMTKQRGAGMIERHGERPDREMDEPSFTIDAGEGRSGTRVRWQLKGGAHFNATVRDGDEPAPTITAHIGKDGDSWAFGRPSTTLCGSDSRVGAPKHHDAQGELHTGATTWEEAGPDKPVALTEAQGCRLMGFPDGTAEKLVGSTKAARWRLIGNAVAPPMVKPILADLTT